MKELNYTDGPSGRAANETWLKGTDVQPGEIDKVIHRQSLRLPTQQRKVELDGASRTLESRAMVIALAHQVKRGDPIANKPASIDDEVVKQAYTEGAAQWGRKQWRGLADLKKFKHFAAWIHQPAKHQLSRADKFERYVEEPVKHAFRHDMVLTWQREQKGTEVKAWSDVPETTQPIFDMAGVTADMFNGFSTAIKAATPQSARLVTQEDSNRIEGSEDEADYDLLDIDFSPAQTAEPHNRSFLKKIFGGGSQPPVSVPTDPNWWTE